MTLLEKEWFIEAPWGRICIVAFGDCTDPPVLVCHGTSDCIASFRPLISLLPKKFYYIGLELPGCGRSDPMPSGLMISAFDLVYSLHVVVKHFRWSQFGYIGHSLGSSLGIFYSLSYPDKISKMILLDPLILAYSVSPENFPKWYKLSFTNYFEDYNKFSALEEKPSYTQEEAINKLMERRGLDSEMARAIMERCCETLDNGHVRFTFDHRFKILNLPPIPEESLKKFLTSLKIPILVIMSEISKKSFFEPASYAFNESSFPNKNYKVRVIEGNHDVHAIHPDRVASFAAQFLLHELTGLEGRSKFTFDPRFKIINFPPITEDVNRKMFTSLKAQILLIITDISKKKLFKPTSYLFDETSFPNKNYKVRVVEGNHDVHAIHPDRVASFVAQFLLHELTGLEGRSKFTFDPRFKILTFPPITEDVNRKMFTSLKAQILLIITDISKKKIFKPTSYLFDETSFPNKNYKVRVVEGNHDVHAIHPDRVAPFVAQFLLHELNGLEGRSKL